MTRALSLFTLLLCLALPSCQRTSISQVVKQLAEAPVDTAGMNSITVNTLDFSAVTIDCFADVTYHQQRAGTPPRVVIKARPEILKEIAYEVDDDKLNIDINRRYRMPERACIVIDIFAPFVNRFTLNAVKCLRLGQLCGSSPVTLDLGGVGALSADSIATPELTAHLRGAGSLDLRGLSLTRLRAELYGVGNITLAGRCDEAQLQLSGAGNIDITRLTHTQPVVAQRDGVGRIKE